MEALAQKIARAELLRAENTAAERPMFVRLLADRELDTVVAELEEAWTPEATLSKPETVAQWPVDVAAKVCPVFRYLTGVL